MTATGAMGVAAAAAVVGALVGAALLGGGESGEEHAKILANTITTTLWTEKVKRDQIEAQHAASVAALRKEVAESGARAEKAEKELSETRGEIESLKAAQEEQRARAESTKAPKDPRPEGGPRFSFGEYDAALREVDWKSVGVSTHSMVPLLSELREALKKGGPLPLESLGKIQQFNGTLIKAAAKIQDKIPGSGINGSYTHPAFMANAIASTLDAAGLPLSDSQAEALGRIGREFSDRDRARLQGYDERTMELQKVLDEAENKDRFFEQAFAVLSPEQRETLSPAATRGVLSLDLFSSGLMLAQHVLPLRAKDREGFVAQVEKTFQEHMKAPEDRKADLRVAIEAWAADLPEEWFSQETEAIMNVQPILRVSTVEEMGRRQLPFFRRIVEEMGLPEESARAIRTGGVVLVPMIRKGN